MKVGGGNVTARLFLLTFATSLRTVSPLRRPRPGIDHQRGARADDDADIGHERNVGVGNDVGVIGQLDGGVLANQRIGRRTALRRDEGRRRRERRPWRGGTRHQTSDDCGGVCHRGRFGGPAGKRSGEECYYAPSVVCAGRTGRECRSDRNHQQEHEACLPRHRCSPPACSRPSAPVAAAPAERTVYVTVVDGNGVAVTDLTAADLVVKEGGKEREIVKAGRRVGEDAADIWPSRSA